MTRVMGTPHLDESDLLRLADADGSRKEMGRWSAHVRDCASCASRFDLLRRRSTRLSDLISEIGLPEGFVYPVAPATPPGRVRSRAWRHPALESGWLRAAALIALLLLPLAAVPPLRATVAGWVSERWTELAALFEGDAAPSGQSAQGMAEEAGATLWFTPRGEELRVEIDSRQVEGSLKLHRTGTAEGSLQVRDGHRGETPVISEQGVRIMNTDHSVANYGLGVPAGVDRVRVRIGDAPPRVFSRADIDRGVEVSLAGGGVAVDG